MVDEVSSGLVGKVFGVDLNQVILLKNPGANVEVAGFIQQLSYNNITLTHENPNNPGRFERNNFFYRNGWFSSRGDRTYHLQRFEEYEKLTAEEFEKTKNEKESQDPLSKRIKQMGIGDLILLTNTYDNFIVAGFIKEYSHNAILLSHENPISNLTYHFRAGYGDSTNGDREYNLNSFNQYQILRKLAPMENRTESSLKI